MIYLTQQHTTPPRVIEHDGVNYPVTRLIELGDTATLATLGVYPHETETGEAPLGYTDWPETPNEQGVYVRTRRGTEAERNGAILGQRINTHRRQYNLRQARKVLSQPLPDSPSGEQVQQRLDAQLLISGVA